MRTLVAAALCLVASAAWGQGASNPEYHREFQSSAVTGVLVSVAATSTAVLGSDGDRRQVTFITDPPIAAGAYVYLCPFGAPVAGSAAPTPTPVVCTSTIAAIVLSSAVPAATEIVSAKVGWTGITSAGTIPIRVWTSK